MSLPQYQVVCISNFIINSGIFLSKGERLDEATEVTWVLSLALSWFVQALTFPWDVTGLISHGI